MATMLAIAPPTQKTPSRILKGNAIAFVGWQLALMGFLFWAWRGHSDALFLAVFCANVVAPPAIGWATYRSCRTAWLGEEENELRDDVFPVSVCAAAGFALWATLRLLLY